MTLVEVRIVGVLPDVPAIDKVFDYSVPPSMDADVRIGTLVRVSLHGRRVGGWVLTDSVLTARHREIPRPGAVKTGRALLPLAKVTGWGPPEDVIDLAEWAAWRWAGRRASLLRTASPPFAVRGLPFGRDEFRMRNSSRPNEVRIVRLPPAADVFPLVLEAARSGPALVLYPSAAEAAACVRRLRAEGIAVASHPREWAQARAGGVTVVGARAAAWAPMPTMAAVVVVDGQDEGYQEERAPTWHARDVALERARRAGVDATVISPCPDLAMTAAVPKVVLPSREEERAGWPVLDVVDRRADDPRTGLFSARFADALRRHDRVVCVLNRKGRARLLACAACGELARCEACASAVAQLDETLSCAACGAVRPSICLACGATRMKALRLGVTRVREELQALAGRTVAEVTGDHDTDDAALDAPVLVGTEAVLHRARGADLVAFLDFDQELLAPRYRAAEQALALLARAGRLVGGRRAAGRVLVQTRLPKHEVIDAALHADPGRLHGPEVERRKLLRFPPFAALALVSGPAAPDLVERIRDIEVVGPDDGRWMLRAPTAKALADALAAAGRPPGRLRIEVDPLRL